MSCEFCSNYHLNSHARLDDCCLGKGDCRKEYFSCNSDLAPKTEKPRTRKEFVKGYNQALEDIFNLVKQNAYDDGVGYSIGVGVLDELVTGLKK